MSISDKEIMEEASKFKSRTAFRDNNLKIYRLMHTRKLGDLCFTPKKIWTSEELQKEALKYSSRTIFKTSAPGAVKASIRLGVYEEICKHIPPQTNRFTPYNMAGIYILYQDDTVVYIGKSTKCIGDRVSRHLKTGKTFNKVELLEIKSIADIDVIELYLINKYHPQYNIKENSGEVLTVEITNLDTVIHSKTIHLL